MRVLLTNNTLALRAGTELYIRDVAVELMRRGHQPVVYSTCLGEIADEIRRETVPVIASLEALGETPDVIHAHHNYEAVAAIMRFPSTPAVSFCHGWFPWEESSLRFPQVRRYVAVSELCRERLVAEGGVAADRIEVLPNFFDPRLFPPRAPLPASPSRALSFSNDVGEQTGLALLRKACERCGIELDAIGRAAGKTEAHPAAVLAKYDIVFARGRAAVEALAVGAAVILCDVGRLGPMVATHNFAALKRLNFALRSLSEPLTEDGLVDAIRHYDAGDAAQVSALARRECDLKTAVDRILTTYHSAIEDARHTGPVPAEESNLALVRYLEDSASYYKAIARSGNDELVELRREIASMRASATWRWSRQILENRLVKRLLGGLIRKAAPRH